MQHCTCGREEEEPFLDKYLEVPIFYVEVRAVPDRLLRGGIRIVGLGTQAIRLYR